MPFQRGICFLGKCRSFAIFTALAGDIEQSELRAHSLSIVHKGFSTNLFADEVDCDEVGKYSFFFITQRFASRTVALASSSI